MANRDRRDRAVLTVLPRCQPVVRGNRGGSEHRRASTRGVCSADHRRECLRLAVPAPRRRRLSLAGSRSLLWTLVAVDRGLHGRRTVLHSAYRTSSLILACPRAAQPGPAGDSMAGWRNLYL